jgi:hypothetical protein
MPTALAQPAENSEPAIAHARHRPSGQILTTPVWESARQQVRAGHQRGPSPSAATFSA